MGFSGGLDSTVLLDLMASAREALGVSVSAIHVHHGLSPNADAWTAACEIFCAARVIPLTIERVEVDRDSPLGVEGAAREARYAAYARQQAGVIALAHHQDDQAETVLLQLLRGTGIKGAAAMPEWRAFAGGHIYRPLLAFPRAALLEYAQARGLAWVEDESNAGSAFDRNFLRRDVLPGLEERFPHWRDALSRFAAHAANANDLLALLGHEDGVPRQAGLPLGALRSGDPARQANALRVFLEANALPMPSANRLAEMARQLFGARPDARVRIEHGGVALVVRRGEVHIDAGADPATPWKTPWLGQGEVALGEGRGTVRFTPARGEGIAAPETPLTAWSFAPRSGGETLRLDPRRPTRTVKNLLQEHGIPAWQRPRLPLLFHGDDLVWVPGVGVSAAYRCPPEAPGLVPEWLPA